MVLFPGGAIRGVFLCLCRHARVGSLLRIRRITLYFTQWLFLHFHFALRIYKLLSNGDQRFSAWFYGLIVTFNFFFLASLGFLHVFNGGDRYDFSNMGPALYGSLILVCVWMLSWPVYLTYRKILSK
jgi:hypothetical protein